MLRMGYDRSTDYKREARAIAYTLLTGNCCSTKIGSLWRELSPQATEGGICEKIKRRLSGALVLQYMLLQIVVLDLLL